MSRLSCIYCANRDGVKRVIPGKQAVIACKIYLHEVNTNCAKDCNDYEFLYSRDNGRRVTAPDPAGYQLYLEIADKHWI